MRTDDSNSAAGPVDHRQFYTVAEAARLLRLSTMTLYRAIEAGQFPAIRIRTRIVVPARAIDEMVGQALDSRRCVEAASWGSTAVA